MKVSDFHEGLVFSDAVRDYKCTDVGSRTITAIALDKDDARWYVGPPYIVPEISFDEKAMKYLFTSADHAIKQSVEDTDATNLTYSHASVKLMMAAKFSEDTQAYPHKGLLRHDRLINGEIHHPFACASEDGKWSVCCLLPYTEEVVRIPESDFLDQPLALRQDYLASKEKYKTRQ